MVPLIQSEVVTDHLNNGNYATNDPKLANQWDRGSSILFEHDAPQLASLALMLQNETSDLIKETLSDYITLHCVDPEDEVDKLAGDITIGLNAIYLQEHLLFTNCYQFFNKSTCTTKKTHQSHHLKA